MDDSNALTDQAPVERRQLLGRFAKHSAVYTLGTVLYRGGAFLLIPLYTHVLTPAEYGILEIYYVTAALLQTFLGAGIARSSLRFYYEFDKLEDRKLVVSTTVLASLAATTAGSLGLWFAAPVFSQLLFHSADHTLAFRIVSCGLVFEIAREVNLAYVRAREQSAFFVVVAITQLVVQVVANVTMVVVLRLGVIGILIGNLTATIAIWIVLSVSSFKFSGFRFDSTIVWPMVKYGAPLMATGIANAAFKSSDRYILNVYGTLTVIGLYALGMRFAQMPRVFLNEPFNTSFGPFRFAVMRRPEAASLYSSILRYYVFVALLIFLSLTAFSEELVSVVAADSYGGAATVIPLLVFPHTLGGVTYVLQTGVYVSKHTKQILYVAMTAGLFRLALNFGLIPVWGIYGAAAANVAAAVLTVILTFVLAQRVYPIRYDFSGIPRMCVAAVATVFVVIAIPDLPLILEVALKAGAIGLFLAFASPGMGVRALHELRMMLKGVGGVRRA